MNELRDLYIQPDELICTNCDRTRNLRSGIEGHLLNVHNIDKNGQPVTAKKPAKRRTVNNNTIRALPKKKGKGKMSMNMPSTSSSIPVTQSGPTTSAAPTASSASEGVTGTVDAIYSVEREKVVGDEDLGGGYVYADADIWY